MPSVPRFVVPPRPRADERGSPGRPATATLVAIGRPPRFITPAKRPLSTAGASPATPAFAQRSAPRFRSQRPHIESSGEAKGEGDAPEVVDDVRDDDLPQQRQSRESNASHGDRRLSRGAAQAVEDDFHPFDVREELDEPTDASATARTPLGRRFATPAASNRARLGSMPRSPATTKMTTTTPSGLLHRLRQSSGGRPTSRQSVHDDSLEPGAAAQAQAHVPVDWSPSKRHGVDAGKLKFVNAGLAEQVAMWVYEKHVDRTG